MKEAYRRGLGHRYGRLMQTIAGIHFNFSLPDAFWQGYLDVADDAGLTASRSAAYFGLTRNFLRHSWLVCYLFGASPAVCKSFLRGRQHNLQAFRDNSFHAPHATSLRPQRTRLQQRCAVHPGDLLQQPGGICRHAAQRHPDPLARVREDPLVQDGKYQQLNPNILQIENEFYAVIRPKQVAHSGESPSSALRDRGVQYVEVRSLDLDPFVPIGICPQTVRFFDLFLLYCLFSGDAPISETERAKAADNRQRVVLEGRRPGLELEIGGRAVAFSSAALDLLDGMSDLADLLDEVCGGGEYRATLTAQRERVRDPSLTPSARILAAMEKDFDSFFSFAMHQATEHERFFKDWVIDEATERHYREEAKASLQRQAEIEASDTMSFDAFLANYFERQNQA